MRNRATALAVLLVFGDVYALTTRFVGILKVVRGSGKHEFSAPLTYSTCNRLQMPIVMKRSIVT